MTSWNAPGTGYYPGQKDYPYPPQNPGYPPQNPGYPPPNPGYPPQNAGYTSQNPGYPPQNLGYPPAPEGYPPPYSSGISPPVPGFVPAPGAPPYGQVPPAAGAPFGAAPQSGMYGSSYVEDPLQNEVKGFEFSDKTIRSGFIKKVYSILMCQLLITLSMIALFLYHKPTQLWVHKHPEMFWISFVITLVLIICMACCTTVRRKAPMNFIFLFLFTVAEAFLLAMAASTYKSEEVLMAVGITAAICFALTIFAFQTKYDFTVLHTTLFIAVIVLLIFGIFAMIWPSKIMQLVYASLGALIFSFYLIYDTQKMIGGDHKYSISPEEYIFAALNLYLDIVNIFIYILAIINTSNK